GSVYDPASCGILYYTIRKSPRQEEILRGKAPGTENFPLRVVCFSVIMNNQDGEAGKNLTLGDSSLRSE
ncbi:MAG: hypothetical protein II779_08725, partial [Clostridia bacterium]|nr:hypothetical protein [Clostridia bacterium]